MPESRNFILQNVEVKLIRLQAVESPKKVLMFPESQTQVSPDHFSAKIN